MLARCTHALTAAGGGAVAPLTEAAREKVLQWVENSGRRQALRCPGARVAEHADGPPAGMRTAM